jgi:hypothetical protein
MSMYPEMDSAARHHPIACGVNARGVAERTDAERSRRRRVETRLAAIAIAPQRPDGDRYADPPCTD